MYGRQPRRARILVLVIGLVAVMFGAIVSGCGGGGEIEGQADTLTSTTTEPDAGTVTAVFLELADAAAAMPVYGPTKVPEGVTVPPTWWPVLEVASPSAYQGPATANPRVLGGTAGDPEVQVVLRSPEGWFVVLENFRGDLGDVVGEGVGQIEGHQATAYDMGEGYLVQWSDGGRWYGVYGRDVSEESVVDLALSMRLLLPSEDR